MLQEAVSQKPSTGIGRISYGLSVIPAFVCANLLALLVLSVGVYGQIFTSVFFSNLSEWGWFLQFLTYATLFYSAYVAVRATVVRLKTVGYSSLLSLLLFLNVTALLLILFLLFAKDKAINTPSQKLPTYTRTYLIFLCVITLVFGISVALSYSSAPVLQHIAPPEDSRRQAPETIEIVGAIPDLLSAEWKEQTQYGNEPVLYFNKSGSVVGYSTARNSVYDPNVQTYYFWAEGGITNGPFTIPDEAFYWYDPNRRLFSFIQPSVGWNTDIAHPENSGSWYALNTSINSAGHSFEVIKTGRTFSTFDTTVPSQSSVLYDGKEVGLHTIQDGKAQSPVYGGLLSADGLHYAYKVRVRDGYYVVVDDMKSKVYSTIQNVHFDGNTLVFNSVSEDFSNFILVKIPVQ